MRRFTLVVITVLIAVSVGAGLSQGTAAAADWCRLQLPTTVGPTERGRFYTMHIVIDRANCTFEAGPVRELTPHERDRFVGHREGGERDRVFTRFPRKEPGDPIVWNRHSSWDCCGFETAYVHHRVSYSYSSCTALNWMETTAWWRVGTGWFKTGGPSHWVNDSSCETNSTTGWASFDNTSFPCPTNCQPCTHTLYSEIRTYSSGAWTRSSYYTSPNYPKICEGYVHTDSTYGME